MLDQIDLAVEPGSIHSLLGPNGAGKTTLTKICAGLLTPDAGSVLVDGIDMVANPRRGRGHIGLALGGERGFYGRASAVENLLFFADVQGLTAKSRQRRVQDALDTVGLADRQDQKVREYSRGMMQRLHLARAILSEPRLLLLDEITSGLDPEIAVQVRDLVRELAHDGAGVLFTSHQLTEVEQLSHTVSVLYQGRIRIRGSVREILQQSGVTHITTGMFVCVERDTLDQLQRIPGALCTVDRFADRTEFTLAWEHTPRQTELEAALTESAIGLVTRPATLEEAYLSLIKKWSADA